MTNMDSNEIRIVGTDGSIVVIPREKIRRIEIDLSHDARIWISPPAPTWWLGDTLAAEITVMFKPGTVPLFQPRVGNGIHVGAIPAPPREDSE